MAAVPSILRERSSYVLIVKPVGKFRPKKTSDRPQQCEVIREDYRDTDAEAAERRAGVYNRTALLKGWKTWAITGVEKKISAAHKKAAAAEKLTGGEHSPELDINVWRRSKLLDGKWGKVIVGKFRLEDDFELTPGKPKDMALAAIAAARQKLDAVEAHVKGLRIKTVA